MTKIKAGVCAVTATWLLVASTGKAGPMGTAFTYQGKLNDGGAPATGLYDFNFKLFDGPSSTTQIGADLYTNAVPVTNGLFTVRLDFVDITHPVSIVYDGSARWLEIWANTNALTPTLLLPRQELTPQAYAIYAARAASAAAADSATSIPWSGVSGFTPGQGIIATPGGLGLDLGLTDLRYWKLGGNAGTTPGLNFLGTTGPDALELKVNGQRALRVEPDSQSPRLIGGYAGNTITTGSGGVIAGGGSSFNPNLLFARYGVVSGGAGNVNFTPFAVVGGGFQNSVDGAFDDTVSGGSYNRINGTANVIAGGTLNTNLVGSFGTIGGGSLNAAQTAYSATIAGGYQNTVVGDDATIGGGSYNTNATTYGTIGGGSYNLNQASSSATIAGGYQNAVFGQDATIGGGSYNILGAAGFPLVGIYSVIGGGYQNQVQRDSATIGGGANNRIDYEASFAAIPGGNSAHAISYGQLAFACGSSGVPGDAQASTYVLRRISLGSGTIEMFLDGEGGGQRIHVPIGAVWALRIHVAGVSTLASRPEFAAYEAVGVVANLPGRAIELHLFDSAGNSILTARPIYESTIFTIDGATPWQATPWVDDATDTLRISVNASPPYNVKWTATVQATEVVQGP